MHLVLHARFKISQPNTRDIQINGIVHLQWRTGPDSVPVEALRKTADEAQPGRPLQWGT
jgi:hypothetical protein